MDLSLFITLLFSLQLIYWFVGRRYSQNMNGANDYFLAGKSVTLFPLMMTFLATQVGGGTVLGAANEAYLYGWAVYLYPFGQALGLALLGLGIGRRLAGCNVSTVAQIFETAYDSPGLRKFASLLSIASLFMILVSQVMASSKFLVSLGMSNQALFLLFWGIVVIYTVQGGLRAVISTDMVQALVLSAIFLASCAFAAFAMPDAMALPVRIEAVDDVSSKLAGWLLMPLLFVIIGQDMGQRCFAGANGKVVSRAALLAGIAMMIVCLVPVFFGVLANKLGLEIPEGGSVLMTAVEKTTTPFLAALVGCAVLAAIISTATSLINAISSNVVGDFNLNAEGTRKAQAITAAITLLAIFCSYYFTNIVDVLIQTYDLSVSCIFVPIAMALIQKRGNYISALLAVSCGAAGFLAFRLYPIAFPRELASILAAFAGFGIGELIALYRQRTVMAA